MRYLQLNENKCLDTCIKMRTTKVVEEYWFLRQIM